MRKNMMKVALVAAVAAMAGYGVYAHQTKEMMSDVMLENVEALAEYETVERDDCEPANDLCSMVVIYPDGDYGEDILLGHQKKPGWL